MNVPADTAATDLRQPETDAGLVPCDVAPESAPDAVTPLFESAAPQVPETAEVIASPIEAPMAEPVAATEPTPAPTPPPATPGTLLRAAREARQFGIQQVTDSLHIDPRLVVAMEGDDFAQFDAPVYARGFLRKYAVFLGVSANEVLAAYERLHAGPGDPSMLPTTAAAAPPRDWSALKGPALAAGLAIVVVAGLLWWVVHRPAKVAPVVALAASAPAVAAEETGGAPSDPTPAVVGAAAASTAASLPAAAPVRPTIVPATVSTYAPARAASSGAALVLEFVADCWVEVTGPGEARLMYDLGRPGESRTVPGPGPWRIALGNVDGVRLRVSGRPVSVPATRRSGEVGRLVVAADGTVQ